MSLGNLTSDIVGTNPVYPKIVNHGWLDVDPATYDNIPTENQRLRLLPQLAEQWGHETNKGPGLVPNMKIIPLTGSDKADPKQDIIKSAKKAMMMGFTGNKVADYLRGRFSKKDIEACSAELERVSEEQGLLGNVYVDASVFNSADEISSFIKNNSCRLAKYAVIAEGQNSSSIEYIFKKKAVSEVSYDADLFDFYKNHLVASNRIPADSVIDSKESLRAAFLMKKEKKVETIEHKEEKPLDFKDASEELAKRSEVHASMNLEAQDAIKFHMAKPIVAYAQELLFLGKTREYVKGALRNKYSSKDLTDASDYLAIVASEQGLTVAHLKNLLNDGKIDSMLTFHELEDIARKYPVVARQEILPEEHKFGKQIGVKAFLFTPKQEPVTAKWASEREASIAALKKGFDVGKVKVKLLTKMSKDEADQVLAEAVASVNASSFTQANPKKKAEKIIIEDKAKRSNAQTKAQMIQENTSIQDFFRGASSDIQVDPSNKEAGIDMSVTFGMDGLDGELSK